MTHNLWEFRFEVTTQTQRGKGVKAQRGKEERTDVQLFNQEVKQQIGKTTLCVCPYDPE